jgi:pimeloyl-ACP methyl ester carboxylesterase
MGRGAVTESGPGVPARNRLVLNTRLGPIGYQDVGAGRPVVFFAGANANGELWTDVAARLEDWYRCVMVDLPLGAHHHPLSSGADRSARSLARLILDVLVLLDLSDAVVVANDTAGGLCLLALAERHDGLDRIGALVLTNCESFEHFPPRGLRLLGVLCRRTPTIACRIVRRSLRSPRGRRRFVGAVASRPLDAARAESFFAPSRDPRIVDDLVRAFATFRPATMLAAAAALERFDRPVLLAWGDRCDFFPMAHADRIAATFPDATVTTIAGARTWVPVDEPAQLATAIAQFAPATDAGRRALSATSPRSQP